MSDKEIVRARIEISVKNQALEVLEPLGLSMSDAIRMFLARVALDGEIPFDLNRKPRSSDDVSTPLPAGVT